MLPVIERIHAELPVAISIDTSKAPVMQAAVAAGATLINDVTALQGEGAVQAAGKGRVPGCLSQPNERIASCWSGSTRHQSGRDGPSFSIRRVASPVHRRWRTLSGISSGWRQTNRKHAGMSDLPRRRICALRFGLSRAGFSIWLATRDIGIATSP